MQVNVLESIFVNSPVRRYMQRKFEVPMLMKLGGIPKTGRIAEVGCGSGYGLRLLLDVFNPKVIHGFDIDDKMLNKASAYLAKEIMDHRVFLHNEDDNLSQIRQNKYGTIFFFGSLHHIPRWRDALNAAYESLDDGGKIYLWEFYRCFTMNPFVKFFLDHPAEAAFSHAELKKELSKYGCNIIGEKNFFNLAGMIVIEKGKHNLQNLNDKKSFAFEELSVKGV